MLLPVPLLYPRRRKTKARQATTTLPAALALVSATYDAGGATVTLAFDRAIDVSGYVPDQVLVNDGITAMAELVGEGTATMLDPNTVRLALTNVGPNVGPGVQLSTGGDAGIVAVDPSAQPWVGANGLALPFP